MLALIPSVPIYLHTETIDIRKSFRRALWDRIIGSSNPISKPMITTVACSCYSKKVLIRECRCMLSDCLPATIRNPLVFSSGRGGEGLFEDGLEEMGGMCASLLDLGFQRPAVRHQ
jgi:hypothetical protein